jgi:hypothetical protein
MIDWRIACLERTNSRDRWWCSRCNTKLSNPTLIEVDSGSPGMVDKREKPKDAMFPVDISSKDRAVAARNVIVDHQAAW